MEYTVYLSLGSNIPPKLSHLRAALEEIGRIHNTEVEQVSKVYLTAPVGYEDQEDFLNLAARVKTSLPPEEFLEYTQNIEAKLLRTRLFRNGPRTIDIDLLLYGEETRCTKELTLPHPRMMERAFVLKPLSEVAQGDLQKQAQKQLAKLKKQRIQLADEQL